MIRTRLQGDSPFFPNMLNNGKVEVCLKEDVDKALAEKDKELRYQKYKRCLNKAEWCDTKADWYYGISESFRDRVEFYIKWRDKWLELTQKFKETK